MNIYPYSSPIILTEDIYVAYGGQTGTMTSAQLQSAFLIAETRATKYIGTFLLPTIVTGSYTYTGHTQIVTDYGYVTRVLDARILLLNGNTSCTLTEESGCILIRDDTYGYLNYVRANSICGCSPWQSPYQYRVTYEAGLPTGTANHPNILHALTIIAEESINEILYPRAGETVGNRAVEQWDSIEYGETRKKWARTALGDSARSAYAAELIRGVIPLARPALVL